MSAGTPFNWAITKAGTTVAFYINGASIAMTSSTLTASDTFTEATVQAWIGADATGASWTVGVIDEVAVYGSALSGARLAAHNDASFA